MQRAELKKWANEKLQGKRMTVFGACLIVSLASAAFSGASSTSSDSDISIVVDLLSIVGNMLVFILQIGLTAFMVNFVTDKEYNIEQVWSKFNNWKLILKVYWHQVLIVFLHMLLLIVPGIIKSYAYSLIPYILADDPQMDSKEILALSEEMMNGHKMDLFMLELSFIGWHLLAILTLGLLEIWIIPYQRTAVTKFLNDIKANHKKVPATEAEVVA